MTMTVKPTKTYKDKTALLNSIPKKGIGVEVGVHLGAGAQQILRCCSPHRLILVDNWRMSDDPTNTRCMRGGADAVEVRYLAVVERFKQDRRVVVWRSDSIDASIVIRRAFLDFVYLDASHLYDNVAKDLHMWASTLVDGGWLMGHDYDSGELYDGVTCAVDEFVQDKELALIRTCEKFSSFAIQVWH
jgi:hypothetical protein